MNAIMVIDAFRDVLCDKLQEFGLGGMGFRRFLTRIHKI